MRHLLPLVAIVCAACLEAPPPTLEDRFRRSTIEAAPGLDLAVVETGDSAGEAVIFLHGYTDTGRSFHGTMHALRRLRPDLRLIALDQRGHGASSMPDSATCAPAPERCFRPADFAADVLALMEQKRIPRAHLVGHSMGSLVAQELALTHPDRVRRLVLIGSSAGTAGHPAVEEFFLAGLIEGPWRDALVRQGRSFPGESYRSLPSDADSAALSWLLANFVVEPLADSGLLATIADETVRIPIGTWLGVARALSTYDNTERLGSLAVPTLVIWGSQDNLFTEADQIRLREALDRAVERCRMGYVWKQYGVKPLPESGQPADDVAHNVQWGVPDAVAADLAAYLREDGMPTEDLPYGTGQGPAAVRTAPGKARLLARMPAECREGPAANES